MKPKIILDQQGFELTINRLCFQLIEKHNNFSEAVILGLQPRGIYLAQRIKSKLEKILQIKDIPYGTLDVTFYRDDFRRRKEPLIPSTTDLEFIIEDKDVILMDDVLYTGRTTRAGLDAMLAFGRPRTVELMTLIDRRFSRNLPIQPDYVGKKVDSITSQRVKVDWKEIDEVDTVWLIGDKK